MLHNRVYYCSMSIGTTTRGLISCEAKFLLRNFPEILRDHELFNIKSRDNNIKPQRQKDRQFTAETQRAQRKTKKPTLYNWGITFSCYRNKMALIISSIFSLRSLRLCGSNKLRS